MSRKVIYARTHESVYMPGVGEMGNTFPPQSKTLENLVMSISELGLSLYFTYKGVVKEGLIPSANIKGMEVVPEEKPLKVVKVSA